MSYINVGANDGGGKRFATKAALKRAVVAAQEQESDDMVFFDQTAMIHSGQIPGTCALSDISEGVILSVCGPDPYESRKWYANVERKSGKVTVK